MHLTIPIEFKKENFNKLKNEQNDGIITIYDSENKPVISTDGYVNEQLLKEMIQLFNKTEKVKINCQKIK